MRVFFGIDVDADVRERVADLIRTLRPAIPRARVVPKENLHMTLRFLGETAREKAEALASTLSRTTAALSGFALDFRGLGVFPNPTRARVLWVGTAEAPRELFALQSAIEKAAREARFEAERGRFHPHLTVARFRDPPPDIGRILKEAEGRDFGSTSVGAFHLYESATSPQGSRYRVIQSFPLSGR